jgi:hypothetical protein
MPKRIGMTLSICNYKTIYICIVVAQDFQVSNSGSWEPLVLDPPNSKVGHFRGNNSYKGSPYNFIQMKTFDELYLRIISASKSFSGSQEEDQNVKS